jgi:L-fuconolactonase
MIIDSHQHFWNYDPIKDSWIDDSMSVLKKDYLPKELKEIYEINSVDGCISVQADQSEDETIFLLNQASKNTFIKGIVGWLDIKSPKLDESLSFYSKNHIFKGLRHIVQDEKENDFMLNSDFQRGLSCLNKYNLTYDILIKDYQMDQTIKMVKKNPNQIFILDHIAKPKILKTIDSLWKKNILELSSNENVYCKVSGLVTETEFLKWKINDFIPYLEVVFEAFGTDRIMYGSDWPVCLLASDFKDTLNILNYYTSSFSENEKNKVMSINAINEYNLSI